MYAMGNWPPDAHQRLLEMGVLREIEPADFVWLWECPHSPTVEPVWHEDAMNGGRVMGFYSCGDEWCGVHVIESDRRRQWVVSVDGIFAAVAQAVGGEVVEVVSRRIALVGALNRDGIYRELFVMRGGGWPDAAEVIGKTQRLCASRLPAVLALDKFPPPYAWTHGKPPIVSLAEVMSVLQNTVHIDLQPLVEQVTSYNTWDAGGWLSVTEAAQLLMRDLPGVELDADRARVSAAENRSSFRTNNLKREQRRIEAVSFSSWRLAQHDKDLDAEDE